MKQNLGPKNYFIFHFAIIQGFLIQLAIQEMLIAQEFSYKNVHIFSLEQSQDFAFILRAAKDEAQLRWSFCVMVWLYISGQLTHISLILYVPFSGKGESKVSFWRWRAASITKFLFIEMEIVQILSCQRNVCLGRPRPCFLKIVFLLFSLQLANRSEYFAKERLRVCQNTYCQIVYLKSCTMLHLQVNNLSFADAMAQTYQRVKKVSQEDGTPTT